MSTHWTSLYLQSCYIFHHSATKSKPTFSMLPFVKSYQCFGNIEKVHDAFRWFWAFYEQRKFCLLRRLYLLWAYCIFDNSVLDHSRILTQKLASSSLGFILRKHCRSCIYTVRKRSLFCGCLNCLLDNDKGLVDISYAS